MREVPAKCMATTCRGKRRVALLIDENNKTKNKTTTSKSTTTITVTTALTTRTVPTPSRTGVKVTLGDHHRWFRHPGMLTATLLCLLYSPMCLFQPPWFIQGSLGVLIKLSRSRSSKISLVPRITMGAFDILT